ncbi:MAG TPA: hypothetical protein VK943_19060, partial [Arenibaculum sp.]|nr:hypothetical protein [Arenibaculum sp.]
CTPDQKLAGGTLAGTAIGAGIGATFGGRTGAIAGGILGTAVGYFLTEALTREERAAYEQALRNQLAFSRADEEQQFVWNNPDGSKLIRTTISAEQPFGTGQAAARRGIELAGGQTIPPNATCRIAESVLSSGEKRIEDPGLWCRNADGDYVRVDGATI